MIDMRKRFRGNYPMPVGKEPEGDKGGQLYAGGRAVGEGAVGGVGKGEGELVEGADGEWRKKEE